MVISLTEESIEPEESGPLLCPSYIDIHIFKGSLEYQHAAHEHKGQNEEPEGRHCEVQPHCLLEGIIYSQQAYLEIHGRDEEGDACAHVPDA